MKKGAGQPIYINKLTNYSLFTREGLWRKVSDTSDMSDRFSKAKSLDRELVRVCGIRVPGIPVQQGNIAFGRHGKGYHKEKGLDSWRWSIEWRARRAMRANGFGNVLFAGPMALSLFFVLRRTNGAPKGVATELHTVRPDLDKLARAVGDALTGVVYLDDSQVIEEHHYKRRAEPGEGTGVYIEVNRIARLGDWHDDDHR